MGMNFYLQQKLTAKEKADVTTHLEAIHQIVGNKVSVIINRNAIHIGKLSTGWRFICDANDFKYFTKENFAEEFIEFLKSGTIVDELNRSYSYKDFVQLLIKSGYTLIEYYIEIGEQLPIKTNAIKDFEAKYNIETDAAGMFEIEHILFTYLSNFS